MGNVRKICPNCNKYYTLNDVFCQSCGVKLVRVEETEQPTENLQNPFSQPVDYGSEIPVITENAAAKGKDRNTGALIAVIVSLSVILLIGLVVLIFLLLRDSDVFKDGIVLGEHVESSITETEPVTTAVTTQENVILTEMTTEPTEPPTEPPRPTFVVVSEACSWETARVRCEEMGGHLAYITCYEDYEEILNQLSGLNLKYAWLGGITSISDDGTVNAIWLNGEEFDYVDQNGLWYTNEPSGRDYTSDTLPYEPYVMIWKINDQWSLNDNSNLALDYYRNEYIGYVCQIDP